MRVQQRMRQFIAIGCALAAMSAGPRTVGAQPAGAPSAGFVVNNSGDASDANLANPACDAGGGVCTLRAAVQQANATAGPDTITFSVTGVITLSAALPIITDTVSLTGPGAALLAVDANAQGAVLRFQSANPAVSFGVSGLTLTGGSGLNGGGVGLLGNAALVISGTVITGNIAQQGGGLNLAGPATLINSTVSHNQATLRGGGIDATNQLEVINSTIQENTEAALPTSALEAQGVSGTYTGGGIYAGGPVTLTSSLVISNAAAGPPAAPLSCAAPCAGAEPAAPSGPFGAGIYVDDSTVFIQGSVIAGNYFLTCITCTAALAEGTPMPNWGPVGPAGAPSPTLVGYGGGLYSNQGVVTLQDTQVFSNTAFTGGGVYSAAGLMRVVRTQVASNTANVGGGLVGSGGEMTLEASSVRANRALTADGGGVTFTGGTLSVQAGDITGNHTVGDGGGLYLVNAAADLDGTLIQGNASGSFLPVNTNGNTAAAEPQVATDQGGGLYAAFVTLTISNTAIVSNTATFGGGISSAANVTLWNSTLSGNRANRDGGGLYSASTPLLAAGQPGLVTAPPPIAQATLLHVTLANNRADANNDSTGSGGGLFMTTGTTVTLHSTLLATNLDGDGVTPTDCAGVVLSTGYNLIQSTLGCTITATTGDQFNVASGVQPLQNNGGGTLTHGLNFGSLALDTADPAQCLPADQRGVPRPYGLGCDIGAFELAALFLPLVLR